MVFMLGAAMLAHTGEIVAGVFQRGLCPVLLPFAFAVVVAVIEEPLTDGVADNEASMAVNTGYETH
jgi:uncharacterized protein involved in propanediol utilization